ncbi:unnamed protein product [Ceutorhynchus assimilis]|uniref:Tube Death domain-containing protein n=1 Tax=Ceutorhynchus assimilis TaxID=467358 RepID=A0A9N9MNF3_9CUCU|nr:unnamed protein product [Ceutorhynchus assimilis]
MDPLIEIRKLSPSVIRHLGSLLDYGDQWKDLMGIVPKQLPKDDFEAHISDSNPAKYTADDIQIIAQGSIQLKKSPTAILIDEWGTSGRPRANLGHLAHLLTQANLFRAADYVSVDLLKNPTVVRPLDGPSSTIKLEINDWMRSEEAANMKTHKNPGLGSLLKMIDYPELDDISESLLNCHGIKKANQNLDFLLEGLEYPYSDGIDSETKSVTNSKEAIGNEMFKMLSSGAGKENKFKKEKLKGMNIQFSETSLESSSVPPISMLLEEVGTEKCNSVSSPGTCNHSFFSGLMEKFKSKNDFEEYSNIPAFSKILNDHQFSKCHENKVKNVDDVSICSRTRRNSL